TQAHVNGTLDHVARLAVSACQGNAAFIPIAFFWLACGLATVGAGNIAASALISPMAMAVAARARIPPFLMTIMVGHGSIAGALSPFSPTGIIARDRMQEIGLAGHEWRIFLDNLAVNVGVAFSGFFLFGGWRLFRHWHTELEAAPEAAPLERRHWVTLAVIALLIAGVVGLDIDIGMGALAGAVVLAVLRLADEQEAVRKMPWGVMVMVSGVTVLTELLAKTGGTQRCTELIGAISDRQSALFVVALITG